MLWLISHTILFFPVLFIGLVLAGELGFHLRQASPNIDAERQAVIASVREGLRVLLSLLLGFSLPMALSHYELRTQLVVEEANAIATVEQRAQTVPEPFRSTVLQLLRQYVDVRIAFGKRGSDESQILANTNYAASLQKEMWQQTVAFIQENPNSTTPLFAQAVGGLSDLIKDRLAAEQRRIPQPVCLIFILVSAVSCYFGGYSASHRVLQAMLIWPLAVAIVLSLVAELDSPRTGLVRVNQQSIERVRLDLQDNTLPNR